MFGVLEDKLIGILLNSNNEHSLISYYYYYYRYRYYDYYDQFLCLSCRLWLCVLGRWML